MSLDPLLGVLTSIKTKVLVHLNALLEILVACLCFIYSHQLHQVLPLPSPTFLVVGFCFALISAALFRLAVKDPIESRWVHLIIALDLGSTIGLIAIIVPQLGKNTQVNIVVFIALAVAHAVLAIMHVIALKYSGYDYAQSPFVTV